MTVPWPVPPEDTGVGFHANPDAYDKPPDFHGHAQAVKAHGGRWWLAWLFDENKADFIRVMRQEGIEVIARLGPAYMPRPNIDIAVLEAYLAAGVRWFVIGNEWNLREEWTVEWKNVEKPVRKCADQFVRYADVIRERSDEAWCLTPPPSLGGHMNHREWFTRFMYAMRNIAAERKLTLRQLLYHCGIGLHCRSVGNPLEAGPSWYDCSAREWEWFRDTLIAMLGETREEFEANPIPMANTEAFDEPQWCRPYLGSYYNWELWRDRNLEQMRWFDPDNQEYQYPPYVMCNTFWVYTAKKDSPWPQCGLVGNYIHFLQRGDWTTLLWPVLPGAIDWTRRDDVMPPPPPPPPPTIKLRVYDASGAKRDLQWARDKYGVRLEQYTGQGKGWHVSEMRERVDCAAGVDMYFYGEDGTPRMGLPVHFCWPGGCDTSKTTEVDGKVGWGYGKDSWIWDPAVGGPHYVEIAAEEPQDSLRGLGMLAMTNHDHLDFSWTFGVLEGTEPQDPEEVITGLAEELLQAIPCPDDWAYPARAIEEGFRYQVGGYSQVEIDGALWGYQTFTNDDQSEYGVAFSPEGEYDKTQWAIVERG
jgi:hypothetical protein